MAADEAAQFRRTTLIRYLLLIGCAVIDVWTFVLGAPPMWADFRSPQVREWNVLFLAIRVLESLFLATLPVSAVLLLIRSRWAIVLGIGQLAVRILCGYTFLSWVVMATFGERGIPNLPWILFAILFEFLRIGATIYALRAQGTGEGALSTRPFAMKWPPAAASVVALTLLLGWLHLRSAAQPSIESLLRRVDETLFTEDERAGSGSSSSAVAVTWQGEELPGSADVDTLGPVDLGAYGIPKSISWMPGCGPWNLEHLLRFELGLFSSPWSETFGSEAWPDRTVTPGELGWRLRFVSVDSLSGPPADVFVPVVRGFQVWIDKAGVPLQGLCELDMKMFGAQAIVMFEFEEVQGRLRIRRILHQIDIATVRILPKLDLRYRDVNGVARFEGADFSIPLEQLSPTLGAVFGGEHFTRLRLLGHRVDRAKTR